MVIKLPKKVLWILFYVFLTPLVAQESAYEFSRRIDDDEVYTFLTTLTYTYWAAYQDRMVIADSSGNTGIAGGAITPSIPAESGFKAGLGCNTYHNEWNLFAEYTWFAASPSLSPAVFTDGIEYNAIYANDLNLLSLTSKFNNQFNIITLTLNKTFLEGGYLSITPWFGLLAAIETEYLTYDYRITSKTTTHEFRGKQDWWGVGPYAGADFSYFLLSHYGFFFRLGACLHVAKHDVSYSLKEYASNGDLEEVTLRMKEIYSDLEPMIEGTLGIRAELPLENINVLFDLGWEVQTYFSHNGFRAVQNSMEADGNYAMQGLTLMIGVNF